MKMENLDLISTRAKVVLGQYALLPPEGLVTNLLPEMPDCEVKVLASRELGADFAQFFVTAPPQCGTVKRFPSDAVREAFLYVLEGEGDILCAGREFHAKKDSFVYAPAGVGLEFCNHGKEDFKFLIQTHEYIPLEGVEAPKPLFGNAYNDEDVILGGRENNPCRELIPHDLSYDWQMVVNIFGPGTHHEFVETHLQQHGLYCLEGRASYILNDAWTPIRKGDFLWVGPYIPHGCYCLGSESFIYLFSKVVNRTPV